MEERKVDKLVVKHNKLVEFKGRMTVNELKLFSLIIADIREQQEKSKEEYHIDIAPLQDTTEHKGFYDYIRNIALRLEDKRIVVDGLDKNNKRYFTTIRLISKPIFKEGGSKLTVEIDRDLIPYIIDLKREFTRYQITNILRLKSSYSIRLYELLKQYESIGAREIIISDLREYLGIAEDEYLRFDNFEARVLKQAKSEINDLYKDGKLVRKGTDINIKYEKIKTGRRITSILFKIESKDQERKIYIDFLNEFYNIKQMKLKMGLKNANFSPEQTMTIYEKAVEKVGNEDIDIFEYIRLNYLNIKDKARNSYSYLLKALENDYASAIAQINLDYYITK